MATKRRTYKDFLVIDVSTKELIDKFDSPCVCDNCNNIMLNGGTLVPVLGSKCICPRCYEEWHLNAHNYPEDRKYELKVFNKFCDILEINNDI